MTGEGRKDFKLFKNDFFVLPVGLCAQTRSVISANNYFSVVEEIKLLFFNGGLYVEILPIHNILPVITLREVLQIVN